MQLTGTPPAKKSPHLRLVISNDALAKSTADHNDYLNFRRSA
jgi:hypothetical protein